jgi:hypothetical protein
VANTYAIHANGKRQSRAALSLSLIPMVLVLQYLRGEAWPGCGYELTTVAFATEDRGSLHEWFSYGNQSQGSRS